VLIQLPPGRRSPPERLQPLLGTDYSLTGTIAGRDEYLRPSFPRGTEPRNRADLLRAYPLGTEVNVIYNPDLPDLVFHGESARVIQAGLNSLDEAPGRFRSAALKTFLPLPLSIIFRFAVRHANQQHQNPGASRGAA
jgi:hypothetical protein